jgi:hypothetical protein
MAQPRVTVPTSSRVFLLVHHVKATEGSCCIQVYATQARLYLMALSAKAIGQQQHNDTEFDTRRWVDDCRGELVVTRAQEETPQNEYACILFGCFFCCPW